MTSVNHTHQLIASNGTYLVKLFGLGVEDAGSLSEVREILGEAPINADSVEYVVLIECVNFKRTSKIVTDEILDAMEKDEVERETEKFRSGDTLESNLEAHLEMADLGFFRWRLWSHHGQAQLHIAAE